MNFLDYQFQALTVMADQQKILERMNNRGPSVMQLQNGLNGLVDEVGELASQIKGHIEYGRTLDRDNLKEEVGDCLWRLGQICDAIETSLETCAELNLKKLKGVRYKDGYSEEAANNRNLTEEEKVFVDVSSVETNYRKNVVPEQTGQGWAEPPEVKLCPHDADPSECNQCMIDSDFAFDSKREG